MKSPQEMYTILLYYQYVPIESPEALQARQKLLCQELDLKGRILISTEGINGTVAGLPANIERYQHITAAEPGLADMEWKTSQATEQVFPKLRVAVRDEIVTLGIKKSGQDVSIDQKAEYIEPEELCQLYDQDADFIILDARNAYEAEIGTFKNALVPPIDAFRDFPNFVRHNLADYKDKDIVTYCTGGVRCEKASAYLREQGFAKVRQLHGGIHVYAEKTGGKHFEGELFVFDKRLHVPVNQVNPTPKSHCLYCQTPITRLVDCVAPGCDGLFVSCQECEANHRAACSPDCEQQITAQP